MRSLSWKRSATFVAVLLLGALPSQAQWAGSSRAPRPVVAQPAAEFGVARVSDDDNAKPMSARMVKAAADPMGDMMPPPPGAMPMTTPPGAAPMMGGDAAPKCTACEAAQSGASCSACDGCNTCDSGCGCGCDYNWWCKLECPDACPQWKMFDDCCCLKEHCTTIEGYLDLGYTAN
ncbi:MAG TPA: hypothetical protein VFE24_10355, partial [Pirellulales bacterium]|nr:hypothetical protein [Pirellulales bacterium]